MPDNKEYGNFNPDNDAHDKLLEVLEETLNDEGSQSTPEVAKKAYCRIEGIEYKDSYSLKKLKQKDGDGNPHELADQEWRVKTLRYNLVPYALEYMRDSGKAEYYEKEDGGKPTKYWTRNVEG